MKIYPQNDCIKQDSKKLRKRKQVGDSRPMRKKRKEAYWQNLAKWKPMDSRGADVSPTSGTAGIESDRGVLSTHKPSTNIPNHKHGEFFFLK